MTATPTTTTNQTTYQPTKQPAIFKRNQRNPASEIKGMSNKCFFKCWSHLQRPTPPPPPPPSHTTAAAWDLPIFRALLFGVADPFSFPFPFACGVPFFGVAFPASFAFLGLVLRILGVFGVVGIAAEAASLLPPLGLPLLLLLLLLLLFSAFWPHAFFDGKSCATAAAASLSTAAFACAAFIAAVPRLFSASPSPPSPLPLMPSAAAFEPAALPPLLV